MRPALKVDPPDLEKLAIAREKRLKEIKMFAIIREIGFYLTFLAIIIMVASNNRDPLTYRAKDALVNMIEAKTNLTQVLPYTDLDSPRLIFAM